MKMANIIQEIASLSNFERMMVVEHTMRLIREETETANELEAAAKALLTDYETDTQSTVFCAPDGDEFCE